MYNELYNTLFLTRMTVHSSLRYYYFLFANILIDFHNFMKSRLHNSVMEDTENDPCLTSLKNLSRSIIDNKYIYS